MGVNNNHHIQLLTSELNRRQAGNPRYSLRAFARALETDAGDLSRLLAGKMPLGPDVARRLADALGLQGNEARLFVESALEQQKQRRAQHTLPQAEAEVTETPHLVDHQDFALISSWYHYAILELTYVDGFRSDVPWIARRLGISRLEARDAVARLLRLGLLRDDGGVYVKTEKTIHTALNQTAPSVRQHFRQILDLAATSLERDEVGSRNMSGMTIPIDLAKVGAAKVMIAEFTQKLCDFLATGAKTDVYQLAICLFPLGHEETR